MNRCFVFPGQGSQSLGMGKELFDNFKLAKDVFYEVDDALNFKLSDVIFGDDENALNITQNTQPALMTVSVATARIVEELSGKPIQQIANYVAGHSLGEYTATIPPTPCGTAFCIASPLNFNIFAVSDKPRTLVAQSAEYSPKECPAT